MSDIKSFIEITHRTATTLYTLFTVYRQAHSYYSQGCMVYDIGKNAYIFIYKPVKRLVKRIEKTATAHTQQQTLHGEIKTYTKAEKTNSIPLTELGTPCDLDIQEDEE